MDPNEGDTPRPPRWLAVTAQVLVGLIPVITAVTALLNALRGTAS